MPQEDQDAYVMVECDLPNGRSLSGKLVHWRVGMRLNALITRFVMTGLQKDMDELWGQFAEATGITEKMVEAACTPISLVELLDFLRRFIALLRPGRTAAQGQAMTPDSTVADAETGLKLKPPKKRRVVP